jgi:DNA-binding MarR family transcriptional regulator
LPKSSSAAADAALRARREQILLRLLVRAFRAINIETVQGVRARGHREMQASFPMLLGNLDTEGTRIGALARRMGTTRQAVSQLARIIEKAGLVERAPDPDDKRGVIIRFTAHGRKTLGDAVKVMTDLERRYEEVLGTKNFAKLKELLTMLLDEIDPRGKLGKD